MSVPDIEPTAAQQANGQQPPAPDSGDDILVRVENVKKYFPIRSVGFTRRTVGQVHAVDDVSLAIPRGRTLGLVGETGCGKSTLARCVAGLIPVTSGTITFEGEKISGLSRRQMQPFRRQIQMIFQTSPEAMPLIRANQAKPIAVTAAKRLVPRRSDYDSLSLGWRAAAAGSG